jgi:hypothetical protein
MSHAFLITAYKDAAQLFVLIDELKRYDGHIYLHIDRKSRQLRRAAGARFGTDQAVSIVRDPVKVSWGGFSHLNAILRLLRMAFEAPSHSHFHLLSGQDFPVVDPSTFRLFFERNQDKQFITCFPLPDNQWKGGGLDRLRYFHLNDILDLRSPIFRAIDKVCVKIQKATKRERKLPDYVDRICGGGTWWSLSRNGADEIVRFIEEHPDYISCFSNTSCSEEVFFQTILYNSPVKDAIAENDLRYVVWTRRASGYPAHLDDSDFEKIVSSKAVFARKFDSNISVALRNRLVRHRDRQQASKSRSHPDLSVDGSNVAEKA